MLAGIPYEVVATFQLYPFPMPFMLCILRHFVCECGSYASALTVTAFSVDRFLAVRSPIHTFLAVKRVRILRIMTVVWAVSILTASAFSAQFGLVYIWVPGANCTIRKSVTCALSKSRELHHSLEASSILFFILPGIMIAVLHVLIIFRLRASASVTAIGMVARRLSSNSMHALVALSNSNHKGQQGSPYPSCQQTPLIPTRRPLSPLTSRLGSRNCSCSSSEFKECTGNVALELQHMHLNRTLATISHPPAVAQTSNSSITVWQNFDQTQNHGPTRNANHTKTPFKIQPATTTSISSPSPSLVQFKQEQISNEIQDKINQRCKLETDKSTMRCLTVACEPDVPRATESRHKSTRSLQNHFSCASRNGEAGSLAIPNANQTQGQNTTTRETGDKIGEKSSAAPAARSSNINLNGRPHSLMGTGGSSSPVIRRLARGFSGDHFGNGVSSITAQSPGTRRLHSHSGVHPATAPVRRRCQCPSGPSASRLQQNSTASAGPGSSLQRSSTETTGTAHGSQCGNAMAHTTSNGSGCGTRRLGSSTCTKMTSMALCTSGSGSGGYPRNLIDRRVRGANRVLGASCSQYSVFTYSYDYSYIRL